MTSLANKTSLKTRWQLPEFIRTDEQYEKFVLFIQAYYEWMEQNNIGSGKQGVIYGTQNLLNYSDVDFTETGQNFNRFIEYYLNEFLPNFPKDSLADKTKLIKIAKQLYQTKGTPASYKFLFRALYDSDVEIFPTRDLILKASDGKWYISKSLRLDSNDETFLITNNLRLFGETSKSFATIERATTVGNKIEVYISDIQRLFQSGENVRVVDNNNNTVYFKDEKIVNPDVVGAKPLIAKVLGSISSVNINTSKRGQLYVGRSATYSGDPVVFYGGLNPTVEEVVAAKAYVNEVTTGSLRAVNVLDGGYGYRPDPNTIIQFSGGGGSGAIANVAAVDPAGEIVVDYIPKDYVRSTIALQKIFKDEGETYTFFPANTSANLDCTLANAFTFSAFSTYPIESVILNNGGGGYRSLPTVRAKSIYETTDVSKTVYGDLASLGVLGPTKILVPGTGYTEGDTLIFTGGSGLGAAGYVSVNASGSITSVTYTAIVNDTDTREYPIGGLGYRDDALPTVTINTSTGEGAVLQVEHVLGSGAVLEGVPDERGIGAITSFIIENFGEDYISAPSVSLKVRDIFVSGLTPDNLPKNGEVVYQGDSLETSTFRAFVDSIEFKVPGDIPENAKYMLRVYNYTTTTNVDLPLKITDRSNGSDINMTVDQNYNTFDASGEPLFVEGVRTYGNGAAQATARFLSGLIIGEGRYINSDGFPSSYQLLQSEDYNNFTYELAVQKSFEAYKEVLYGLLHPSGTKVRTINRLKNQVATDESLVTYTSNNTTLSYITNVNSNATIFTSFTNPSNNIVKFDNLGGTNPSEFLFINEIVELVSESGPNVYSKIIDLDYDSQTVVLKDNVYTHFANVAIADIDSLDSTKINITEITNAYDLINNGEYSNTENKLIDIAFEFDNIRIYKDDANVYEGTIEYVSKSNSAIFVYPAITFTGNNCMISVGRDSVYFAQDIRLYNSLSNPNFSQIVTESGDVLVTEDETPITIG